MLLAGNLLLQMLNSDTTLLVTEFLTISRYIVLVPSEFDVVWLVFQPPIGGLTIPSVVNPLSIITHSDESLK